MTEPDRLFDRVVDASRLSRVIAPFTVSRLLISVGVLPDQMTPEDLRRALPRLEEGLAVYLQADELRAAVEGVRRLAT